MTSLVFQHNHSLPYTYEPSNSTYTACLECATAHEIRYCDGSTIPSWKLCEKHQHMTQHHYKREILECLQEGAHDGSIPKPKPKTESDPTRIRTTRLPYHHGPGFNNQRKPEQSPPETDLDLDPEIEILRSQQPPQVPTQPRAFRKKAIHILWPHPSKEYQHTPDCFHHPSANFQTPASLPQTDSPSNSNPETDTDTDTEPEPEASNLKILSHATLTALTHAQQAHLSHLHAENQARWNRNEYSAWHELRILTLQEDMRTTDVARAVFYRRCHGGYLNGVGWDWNDMMALLGRNEGVETRVRTDRYLAREEMMRLSRERDELSLVRVMWIWSQPENRK